MSVRRAALRLATRLLAVLIVLAGLALTLSRAAPFGPSMAFAFVSDRSGDEDVYLMDAERQMVLRLTHSDGRDREPAWSPDGRRLAFASERDGDFDIYVLDLFCADAGNCPNEPRPLSENDAQDNDPAWSPDGSQIAFVSTRMSGGELFVVDVACLETAGRCERAARRLTSNFVWDSGPAWSPDGRLAFESTQRGSLDLYMLDATCVSNPESCDHAAQQLTSSPPSEGDAAWSPDGRWIAFSTPRFGDPDIYLFDMHCMGPEETCLRNLTDSFGGDARPGWSPDGRHLVFESARDGNLELYVVDVDGGNLRRLTFSAAQEWAAAWWP